MKAETLLANAVLKVPIVGHCCDLVLIPVHCPQRSLTYKPNLLHHRPILYS